MKKVILLTLTLMLSLSTVVYAAATWNGYPIIQVLSGGKQLQGDTPAVSIKGASYVPLKMLRQAGLNVTYDAKTKAVSVEVPQKPVEAPKTGLTLEQLNTIGQSVALVYELDAQGKQIGTGSGFVTGLTFVTNWHVADGNAVSLLADFGTVQKTFKVADAVFKNETADLIGFKMDGISGLSLNVGVPTKGDKVYSLSYPHHKFQITEGVYNFTYKDTVSHTASVTSGSSGGAVIDSKGQVIGVTASGIEGTLSYAVSASILKQELDKLG